MPNPYQEITYRCAVCSKRRGEANHWLIAVVTSHEFSLTLWDDKIMEAANAQPLCSQGCAAEAQSRFLHELHSKHPQLRLTQ